MSADVWSALLLDALGWHSDDFGPALEEAFDVVGTAHRDRRGCFDALVVVRTRSTSQNEALVVRGVATWRLPC